MANDWSGLDYLNQNNNLIFWLRTGMDELALEGEGAAMMNQRWNNDTFSLEASITGYEAGIGDPKANFRDPRWVRAQWEGNAAYQGKRSGWRNPPEHYEPFAGETVDLGERRDPVAVVSVWTQYPDEGKLKDIELWSQVEDTLLAAMNEMGQRAERVMSGALDDVDKMFP